jgi:subtilase family serine protease
MKTNHIMTAAASVLGVVTFVVSMAVTEPVSAQLSKITWVSSRPAAQGELASSQAPDGTVFDPWHAYTPAEFCAAYNLDKLHAEGINGRGQTVVIVNAWGSPTAREDLKTFCKTFGLPEANLTIVYPNGKPSSYDESGTWMQETSLDLQWAHVVAPQARLVLIATCPANPEDVFSVVDSLYDGVRYAVEHYPGSTISQSWSAPEEYWFGGSQAIQIAQFDKLYLRAVLARCTVLCASGDNGSTEPDINGNFYSFPVVDWPASDPLVTGVGGTWLQYGWRWDPLISTEAFYETGDVGSYLNSIDLAGSRTEAVWKEDWFNLLAGYGYCATGGGLSKVFRTPWFQYGLSRNLLQGRRGVPDISFNAATDGGVMVCCQEGWAATGEPWPGTWGLVGGTSASTPELAGLVALANQARAQHNKPPIGYLNPILYLLPARDFKDIVPETFGEGPGVTVLDDNSNFGSGVPGYKTTRGYDLTTGLGSPKAYWFVHDLANAP